MVKETLKEAKKHENITLVDIWTWSGNIAISCLLNSKKIKNCFIIDKSKKALEVAKVNVKNYNLQDKITILKWSLLKPILKPLSPTLSPNQGKGNMIITANLPYIKNWDYKNMSSETLKYEPKMALFWGEITGFELYEKLINEIIKLNFYKSRNLIDKKRLNFKVKTLFIEIWFDQYEYSKKYLENLWLNHEYFKDNSWIWRCVKIWF
jgi:methylase of polypeptide subunit release factors